MSLELLALMALLVLLLTKEVVTNLPVENTGTFNRKLNIAIAPLVIIFLGLIVVRFSEILSS
jgi:hypothetical protein